MVSGILEVHGLSADVNATTASPANHPLPLLHTPSKQVSLTRLRQTDGQTIGYVTDNRNRRLGSTTPLPLSTPRCLLTPRSPQLLLLLLLLLLHSPLLASSSSSEVVETPGGAAEGGPAASPPGGPPRRTRSRRCRPWRRAPGVTPPPARCSGAWTAPPAAATGRWLAHASRPRG